MGSRVRGFLVKLGVKVFQIDKWESLPRSRVPDVRFNAQGAAFQQWLRAEGAAFRVYRGTSLIRNTQPPRITIGS